MLPVTQQAASKMAADGYHMTHTYESWPIKGRTAAVAQSLHARQQNLLATATEIARKPTEGVMGEDAADVQWKEVSWPCGFRGRRRLDRTS